jgi:DNA-binding beta-propeller fold protein YncE
MKLALRIVAIVAVLATVVIVSGLAWLIYPGHPSVSRTLRFERYVLLPRHGLLNVLDYMKVEGHSLFVGGTSAGSVIRVDLDAADNSVSEWRDDGRVHGIALAGSRDLAFATRSEINAVDAFVPSTLKQIDRIGVPDDPDAILYDPMHDIIYVANGDAGVATLISPTTRVKAGTIALGGKPEFAAFEPRSGLVYQNIESTDELAAIDLGKLRIVGRWPMKPCQGPTGIAIDSVLKRAFVVCGKNAMLVVFDLERDRVVATLKIGRGPDAVAFDPGLKRIYATGLGGQVSVTAQLGADSYRNLDIVSTHFAAHTLAVDPRTHAVYVGYASLAVPPRIAVFSPAPQ